MKISSLLSILVILSVDFCRANFGAELKSYGFGTSDIVRDEHRDRVYCAVPAQNSVVVIDSESLQVLATIFTGSQPAGLDISADGTKLYVANQGSTTQGIAVIDLETLTIARHIETTTAPYDVAIGNGTVYSLEGTIRAYSASDGALLAGALGGAVSVYGGILEISPDGNTLYYYQTGLSPSSWYRINVTSWPGVPVQSGQFGSNGQDMALSADGQWLTFASGAPYSINKLQASNPTASLGQMNTGPYPRAVTYSPDGNYLFAVHTSGHIDVWNANTFVQLPQISTVGEPHDLECDRKGKSFFAGTGSSLRAYYIGTDTSGGTVDVDINHAVEIRWSSAFGSLYQVEWRSQLGGDSSWYNLGGPVLGNGLTMSVFDTTRGSRFKFYRVTRLSQ
jgi:YVTN family beta-propeller protein